MGPRNMPVWTGCWFTQDADKPFEYRTQAEIVTVPDPEILLENLVESKHHKLARSLRSGPTDRDMKPDAKTRDHLNSIVAYPPTKQLTSEEEDLVWKFRFYLSTQNKALTKFLKCVNWSLPQEAKQALELLNRWSPMDVDDALELLGPAFTHPAVRKYAVMRLRQADDEDLLLFLLQLVQALKYENFEEIKQGFDAATTDSSPSPETPPTPEKDRSSSIMSRSTSQDSILEALSNEIDRDGTPEKTLEDEMDLATYLISRSCSNFTVANYFYWYLHVECEDQGTAAKEDIKIKDMYLTVLKRFSQALSQRSHDCKVRRSTLASQQMFIDRLVKLVKIVTRESGNRKKKIERLQALLQDVDVCKMNFADFDMLPLPLDPDVKVTGIIPESATLFKSALMPCRLTFRTSDGHDFVTIFKHGDDLRQDQLILQSIQLMDKLLRKENLDLKMSPYKVLATSSKHGFVQFIESFAVAEVLDKDGTIQNFFRKHAPSENGPYGIAPEVMDNYVKSCAGYSIVTYLLGVGDRHLDNLLLTTTGKLFHIDFGYILGRDPKPLPPPMKLSKEMVEAMGGPNSEHFHDFKKYCYTAFLALRRSSNLIMNLFSLMVNANIPDIALEPDKTVKKVQEKFVLHYTDEEAVSYIQSLIDVSTSAMMPALVEQLHKMAQYWRK
ncbi:phosphatidylinositol 3-kinase catalytic subunit type 3 isoform X3 [Patella vulgata]|uniref:phosphatidylinositol 3-kinase catalytic subunit type 3 isoform X3 n=1 Tax=Patella vulgata TaxID=6465 RepID=UPI0021800CD8|nr:phosphatidylinositol 3-kinase catalytic subunit type 3 isoform X3 [Patella vulgata]